MHHEQLVGDLYDTGIRGSALSWFISYLSDRRQRVVIGLDRSELAQVTCGVPQGSVLGPTLFLLYVKDLPTIVNPSVSVLQYADDIMLHSSHTEERAVQESLTAAVSSLAMWLKSRGLILNPSKSQVLWVAPGRTSVEAVIHCNGVPLPNVPEAKYLGVTFDQGLTWKSHVRNKARVVTQQAGALRRAKNSLTIGARYKYYSSVITANILYGSNAFVSNLPSSCLRY